jgi:pentatricopeptide repeat domain-containing protein 1
LLGTLAGIAEWLHANVQGVDPVLRTYNTLIIACNMCGQPREAMAVHRRMLDAGYNPNATTYNALISAYGKNGQLDKVCSCPTP